MRRWIKVSVAAAAVLGVGGWIAEPYVRDWIVVRNACEGALPQDAARRLAPEDTHLGSAESRRTEGLGSWTCRVTLDGERGRLVEMEAYTRRDDQDRTYMTVFPQEGMAPQAPLPGGLPGFVDRFGTIQLVLACPDLGRDPDGGRRTLLVRTSTGSYDHTGEPGAVYRTAVALANAASGKLGCGAEPLKTPEGDPALPRPQDGGDDPEPVPLSRAAEGPCGWAARAGLKGRDWHVVSRLGDAAPTGFCALTDAPDEGSGPGEAPLSVFAWYGDWSNRLVVGSNGERRSFTATARCDGESANFALSASTGTREAGTAEKRRVLETFAKDQVRRRGCEEPRFF
ncbi:hypothetical protein [Streptomyces sp. NPDC047108]|uniref:hypothetical protein n=1 Tax=Streptomyces sp. NPDC047108 TaxID=3155025 RepID=UPI0033C5FCDD